jgi:hypothetical protein
VQLDFDAICAEIDAGQSSLLDLLTPKQLEIEQDPAWLRIAYGGRQWGKTTWSGAAHALAAIPGATSFAVAPTVTKARDLLLPGVEWLNTNCAAGIKLRQGDTITFHMPSGAAIQCLGMSNAREAEKIRGGTPPFITIEECGTYKPELLKFAIEACCTPAQMKWFKNGGRGLALIGTPGLTENDYWHQQCKGEWGASTHHATVHDNPYIPYPEEFLEMILRNNAKHGWTRTTPRFRREYLGEFCSESDSMCYSWDKVILPQHAAPDGGQTFLGLDLGATRSPSAWVVIRITREMQDKTWRWIIHVIHSESGMTATVHDVVAKTSELKKRFGVTRMRGDSAGMGAMTLDTMSQKFQGVHVEHAPKAKQKLERIWLMSSMLQTGAMRIYEGARSLGDQMLAVPWNDDKDDHHPSYPDHECDAAQYVVELANQWTKEQTPSGPEPGSKEFRLREMARYKQEAIMRGEREPD